MEQNKKTKIHECTNDGHCCGCEGCGVVCFKRNPAIRRYWTRHFLVLIFGVIAAFFVGYHLGQLKGYLMSGYAPYPMHDQGWGDSNGWMMR